VIDHRTLSRRSALKLAGSGVLVATATRVGLNPAAAQDATPAAGGGELTALGLPELNVTISDSAYEGLSGELAAGMYLVHANYTGSEFGNLAFMQLPEGMTSADLMSALMGGGEGEASPVAEGGEEGGDAPPDWFYTVYIPGGVGLGAGQSASFVIDLQPGNYIVWGEDPSAMQAPVDLTVTGGGATPVAGESVLPVSGVTIDEIASDSGFTFGVQGDFSSGSQVVTVTNSSDQPHFVEFDTVPEGTTIEDVDALIQSFMTGTPTAGGLAESDVTPVYFVGTQSANTTQWHEVALESGTYLISCWIPDPSQGGIPHAMEGMYDIITIG
jgi:hypothetical protein